MSSGPSGMILRAANGIHGTIMKEHNRAQVHIKLRCKEQSNAQGTGVCSGGGGGLQGNEIQLLGRTNKGHNGLIGMPHWHPGQV